MSYNLSNPRISVIMPVYNNAPYLNEAIDCILNQTFPDFEFIILNDGSTDGSGTIINDYAKLDNRIIVINDSINKGFIYRLNQGLNLAKGEFIARADGDDICVQDRFEKQIKYLESHPEIVICSAWYEYFGNKMGVVTLPVDHEDIKIFLLENSAIVHALIMARHSFFDNNNVTYDPNAIAAEDYDLWTRVADRAVFANLPEVMLKYRIHSTQTSTKDAELQWENSDKCRIRMLNYIWDIDNDEDKRLATLIARPSAIFRIQDVESIFEKLGYLIAENKKKHFFNETGFNLYVKTKKNNIVKSFYQNKEIHNLEALNEFLKASRYLKKELTNFEKIKFIIKCFILWKKRK